MQRSPRRTEATTASERVIMRVCRGGWPQRRHCVRGEIKLAKRQNFYRTLSINKDKNILY
jgi:hypothetical protein